MKDLISIIIPVYNKQKYINRCIDSVLNQTYKNIEIIIVDDGSSDNSSALCDEYVFKDDRIKVIHKKNGGLSDARNIGLTKVNGKYLTFIDSDDAIYDNYIEHLYKLINKYKCDMSVAELEIIPSRLKKRKVYSDRKIDKITALKDLLKGGISVSSCAKMYNTKLFCNIKFPYGKIYEDNFTTYKLIEKCDYIAISNKKIYKYIKNKNSITNSKFNRKKLDLIELTDLMCRDLSRYKELSNAIEVKKNEVRFSILRQVVSTKPFDREVYIECKKYIFKHKCYILKNPESNVRQKIAYFTLLFGSKFFYFSWKMYTLFIK